MRCCADERLLEGPEDEGARHRRPGQRLRGGFAPVRGLAGDHRALREAQARDWGGGREALPGQRTPSICKNAEERRALWAQLEANPEATLECHREAWEE
ncbi:MAG: hypothetical protein M3P37_11055, partial [Actinomycetota bacterium]|nr:hypothetical protein [Actinomycetota bacterium]